MKIVGNLLIGISLILNFILIYLISSGSMESFTTVLIIEGVLFSLGLFIRRYGDYGKKL